MAGKLLSRNWTNDKIGIFNPDGIPIVEIALMQVAGVATISVHHPDLFPTRAIGPEYDLRPIG